jgi:hypothetical protein
MAGILRFVNFINFCLLVLFLHLVPDSLHACTFTPTMPARSFQICKRAPKSRVYSGSRLGGKDQKVKVLKASEVGERKRQVEERWNKEQELRKTFLITREHTIDIFLTGRTARMRQKIAEVGMTANREPDTMDWEVVPDAPSYDDPMGLDSHFDGWQDLVEEDLGDEGQTGGQRVTQHARLQEIITCVSSFFPCHHVSLIAP